VLRIDAEFAREDGEMFELFAFLEQPLLAELGEPVEQMIDDVGDEYVDADAVGHLLSLAFHLHVERHYHSISTTSAQLFSTAAVLIYFQFAPSPTRGVQSTGQSIPDCLSVHSHKLITTRPTMTSLHFCARCLCHILVGNLTTTPTTPHDQNNRSVNKNLLNTTVNVSRNPHDLNTVKILIAE